MTKARENRLKRRLNYNVLMKKIFCFLDRLDEEAWKIKFGRIKEHADPGYRQTFGFTNLRTREIWIDIRASPIMTLLHESLHAILFNWDATEQYEEECAHLIENYLGQRLTEKHIIKLMRHLSRGDRLLTRSFSPVAFPKRDKHELDKLLKP